MLIPLLSVFGKLFVTVFSLIFVIKFKPNLIIIKGFPETDVKKTTKVERKNRGI